MPPFTFETPAALFVATIVAAVAIVTALVRRTSLPAASKTLAAAGLLLVVLAAGQPQSRRPVAGEVAVLIDLSASTRTAGYRDRGALEKRIAALLGNTPYRLYTFAGGPPTPDAGGPLVDLPGDRTVLAPPAAAAVLLFSDGRFALPASSPPTYAVIDANLSAAVDARVDSLRLDNGTAAARVESNAARRTLTWTGTGGAAPDAVAAGGYVFRRPIANAASEVTARLSGGDPWPENDALSARPPPPAAAATWFVSAAAAPAGFVRVDPAELPTDPAAYLGAAAIVLDNVPADRLPPAARDRLAQHVRDLGGGLVITGGDAAFAAGAYVGTPIEAISPLASVPPRPATRWLLLTDASGSMSGTIGGSGGDGGGTRWQAATAALVRLLPSLPPDDPVDVGSFAEALTWWSSGRAAAETLTLSLPPPGVAPRGPTNLEAAVIDAANRHDPALPGHLLVLSDADAEVKNVPALVALLTSRNLKLHVLAVTGGSGLADLSRAAAETGGKLVRQDDASRWAAAAAELLSGAADRRLVTAPAAVTFGGPMASLDGRSVAPWNRTFLKPRATELAKTTDAGGDVPMAAVWQAGEGRVAAAAFGASADERDALVGLVARPPRDPRLTVAWEAGPTLRVRVDAASPADDREPYLNGRTVVLELAGDGAGVERHTVPQTTPGRYELTLPAPASPRLATVRFDGRPADRFAVAGRYAAEFDGVGVDRDRLEQLARQSGGRVIEPNDGKAIDFRWARREVPIGPWAAAGGALLLAAALVWWRMA